LEGGVLAGIALGESRQLHTQGIDPLVQRQWLALQGDAAHGMRPGGANCAARLGLD
jgi:hypothetical protein